MLQDSSAHRHGHFAMVPTLAGETKGLSKGAIRTLIVLGAHANKARKAWCRQQTIADCLGAHRRSVRTWLAELESFGLIRSERYMREKGGWGSNFYLVAPFPEGAHMPPSVRDIEGAHMPPSDGADSAPSHGAHMPPRTESLNRVFEQSSNKGADAPSETWKRKAQELTERTFQAPVLPDGPDVWEAKRRAARKAAKQQTADADA